VPKKSKPTAPLLPLTGKQKSYLRSLAHKLKPVVQVGHQGVTPGVLAAMDVALDRHELIKVKVAGEAEVDAAEIGPQLEKATKSQVAQIIGHTLVVYRRRKENPKIVLPKDKPKRASAQAASAKGPVADDSDEDGDELEDDDALGDGDEAADDDEDLEDDEDDDEDLEDDEEEE
jgi:RNA-binding protein